MDVAIPATRCPLATGVYIHLSNMIDVRRCVVRAVQKEDTGGDNISLRALFWLRFGTFAHTLIMKHIPHS